MQEVSAQQVRQMLTDMSEPPLLLDVREEQEVAICRIDGSVNIPMAQIAAELAQLDHEKPVIVICHHGMRSYQVAVFLEQQGFEEVYNLDGGIDSWAREVDPQMATY